mmetsp:Transcript_22957/g.57828  ORF Transcript_22957/g.57828 Transcript_22957/m.57828 type:complete len:343 (+) Transcript_22957:227-1255(+)
MMRAAASTLARSWPTAGWTAARALAIASSGGIGGLESSDSYRPRRALLYMPADNERKVSKAAREIDVDVVCIDCEDAVALTQKEAARNKVAEYLATMDFGRSERAVRINSLSSGVAEADLEAVLRGPVLPDAIVIPKVDSAADLHHIVAMILDLAAQHPAGEPIKLITMCESAYGLLHLREVLEAAAGLGLLGGAGAALRLEAAILGGDDFAASVGATRSAGSRELLFARQCFLTHCHAYGIQPIDIVQINYKDDELLATEAADGSAMGFEGKQVIHPRQVPIVQAHFSPSEAVVAAAEELVAAFGAHQATGAGTFVFKGQMIDNPTMLQARNVLARANTGS